MSEIKNVEKKIPAFNIVLQKESDGKLMGVARVTLWKNGSATVNAPDFTGKGDSPYGKLRVAMWKYKKRENENPLSQTGGE